MTTRNSTNDYQLFLRTLSCFFALSFVLFSVYTVRTVRAAELRFEVKTKTLPVNQPFSAALVLNTEGEIINALSGVIRLPKGVELQEIRDGNTVVSFWVERPGRTSDRGITFAGMIPGGYQGTEGLLFTLILKASEPDKVSLGVAEATVLRHDGAGTAVAVTRPALSLSVAPGGRGAGETLALVDTDPPELFTPEISREESLFDRQWFVAFATQDKGSGIDYYEVSETTRSYTKLDELDAPRVVWQRAESPYVLADQTLRSFIYIKAVDKKGNTRLAVVAPRAIPWYTNYRFWVILMVLIGLGASLLLWLRRKPDR